MIRLARCTQANKAGHKAGLYFRLHLEPGDFDQEPVFPCSPEWFGEGAKEVRLGEYVSPTAKYLTRPGRGLHPHKPLRLAPSGTCG